MSTLSCHGRPIFETYVFVGILKRGDYFIDFYHDLSYRFAMVSNMTGRIDSILDTVKEPENFGVTGG